MLTISNIHRIKRTKNYILISFFILLFIIYGVLLPFLNQNSSFLQAVKAGKAFFHYFFFFYVITLNKKIDFTKIFNFIVFIGIYFSAIVWLFELTKIAPPYYITSKTDTFLRVYYPTFISLAIFWKLFKNFNKQKIALFEFLIIFYLISGLYFLEFFSITSTTIGLSLLILIYNTNRFGKLYSASLIIIVMTILVFFHLNNYFEEEVREIIDNQTSALLTRDNYNSFRWDIIKTNEYFGFGFLDRDVEIINESDAYEGSGYMNSLSFIDAGYVDLIGKFGLIGTIIFLLLPAYFIWISKKINNGYIIGLFIFQYFFINITWSVFTFPHGIIPLIIVYGFIYQQYTLTAVKFNKLQNSKHVK